MVEFEVISCIWHLNYHRNVKFTPSYVN